MESHEPILRDAASECRHGQGRPGESLGELRCVLTSDGWWLDDASRRGLSELTARLARVQALGGRYASIALSPHVLRAVGDASVVV
jgi:hypothetical protein